MLKASRILAAILLSQALWTGMARAEEQQEQDAGLVWQFGDLGVGLGFDIGLGLYGLENAQHGVGSFTPSGKRRAHPKWVDSYLAAGLSVDYQLDSSSLYAGLKLIGTATRGDGDAQLESSTSDQPQKLAIDNLFLGWKSGTAFAALGEDAVDISAGRQDFTIGDGFLVMDGTAEGFRRAAYALSPRNALDRTAILRLNTRPVRADLFHLEARVDQAELDGLDAPATQLYGGNIEWFASNEEDHGRFSYENRLWYLGLTALHLYEADRDIAPTRDGMDVISLRSGGAILSPLGGSFEDFALYAEYGIQRNDDASARQRASAWYVEPQYSFSALPWAPRLSYRYARFSGDGNPEDGVDRNWDPLYTGGGPRGFGSWDQGEIYARYVGGNSNLNTHMVHLRTQPLDELGIGAIWYHHRLDSAIPAWGITSEDLMDEINLYAEWETPVPRLLVTGVLGAARAGSARKQDLMNNTGVEADDTSFLGQLLIFYSF